ncbi:MAG: flagellar motor switch protein FliN [Deltaproteobacteria bacterium]|nr:flagellar motor switch protein FliN [Deltaproteobacteria bacterium]
MSNRETGTKYLGLDSIVDVSLDVSVELGRTRLSIEQILELGQGGIVELTKTAGEPLDILINDKLVAHGEAVVVGDKFGVRITSIVSRPDATSSHTEAGEKK